MRLRGCANQFVDKVTLLVACRAWWVSGLASRALRLLPKRGGRASWTLG